MEGVNEHTRWKIGGKFPKEKDWHKTMKWIEMRDDDILIESRLFDEDDVVKATNDSGDK